MPYKIAAGTAKMFGSMGRSLVTIATKGVVDAHSSLQKYITGEKVNLYDYKEKNNKVG